MFYLVFLILFYLTSKFLSIIFTFSVLCLISIKTGHLNFWKRYYYLWGIFQSLLVYDWYGRLTWQWNLANPFNLGYEMIDINSNEYFWRIPSDLTFSASWPYLKANDQINLLNQSSECDHKPYFWSISSFILNMRRVNFQTFSEGNSQHHFYWYIWTYYHQSSIQL